MSIGNRGEGPQGAEKILRPSGRHQQGKDMTPPYIANSSTWAMCLRVLMGYPAYAPACHAVSWCTSGPRDVFQVLQLTQIAADMRHDLVHLAFGSAAANAEPIGVSLAIRQDAGVEWLPGAKLYAASETAPIELLAGDRRWFIGPRRMLISAKLPPRHRRAQGEEIAMRRWKHAVANTQPFELEGSVLVPVGQRYADAIPMEELRVAA